MTIARIGKEHWRERGNRIEVARIKAGYRRQGELAVDLSKVLGRSYSRTIISNIEKGDRRVTTDELTALAYLLDQSEEWLNVQPGGVFNSMPERRHPDIVVPLNSALGTTYRELWDNPHGTRAHDHTDWDHRPIDIQVQGGKVAA